jgi:predicted anti-sigma-YlaC factor YlaD
MNTCDDVIRALEQALDAGATEAPVALRPHLASCGSCRAAWRDLRAAEDLLAAAADLDIPAPPPRLQERVMHAVARERRHGPPRISAEWWLAAAAVLLLGVFGVLRLVGSGTESAGGAATYREEVPTAAELGAFAAAAEPRQIVSAARQDFAWLGSALLSNARSAARMVGGAPQP